MSKSAGSKNHDEHVHVFQSNSLGLPHLPTYFRELWRRRDFAFEMSKSTLRTQQVNSFIGKFWLVLNPLLLATVYYFLVMVLSGGKNSGSDYFVHLVAGIFVFYFVAACMSTGASSITGAGRLITNSSFPRLLLPIASVRTALGRFLPTVPIFFILFFVTDSQFKWEQLLAIPVFFSIVMFSFGMAAFFGALQVYFRDTASFLPYLTRILLYISPVLWYQDQAREVFRLVGVVNPLFPLIGAYSDLLVRGQMPSMLTWIMCIAWSILSVVFGSWFFMAREREFAVRL